MAPLSIGGPAVLLTADANADLLDAAAWVKSATPVFASNAADGRP